MGERQEASSNRETEDRVASWVALLLVALGAAAIRIRTLSVPLERDEGGYAYLGQRMLLGEPPFASGYSMHMPGTAAAYAMAIASFGPTGSGVRLGLLFVHLATLGFAFLLARGLYGGVGAAACAAAYATLSTFPEMHGLFGHATQFVSLFAVSGLWAFVHALTSRDVRWLLLAGVLLGFAPVMKQSGAVFPIFALSWLAWTKWKEPKRGAMATWRDLLIFAFATAAPTTLIMGLLAGAGVFGDAWRWMFSYASRYSGMQSLSDGLATLGSRAAAIGVPGAGFLGLALLGLLIGDSGRSSKGSAPGRGFLAALLVFSFLGLMPGLYFRHHYFVAMLPAVSLLFGRAVAQLTQRGQAGTAIAAGALLASIALSLVMHREMLFISAPVEISRDVYGANPFPESVEVARYIQAHTDPGDLIAVLGSEPQIYFYSGRRSATRYLYLYPLLEPNPFAAEMKQELMGEIEAARPAFVVWVNTPTSWDTRVGAARPVIAWADRFLGANYELVGRVAIRGPRQTDYSWDEDARRLGPEGASVLIFGRRTP